MKVLRITVDFGVDDEPELIGCDVLLEAERGPMSVHVDLTAADKELNRSASGLRNRALTVARETIRQWAL